MSIRNKKLNNQAKIHYLIIAHKNFNQVELLINKLKTQNSKVFLHIDGKVKNFPEFKNAILIKNRIKTNRGGFSQIETETTGVKQIYENMKEGDHLVIISGQCWPIQKMENIERYIYNLGNTSCLPFEMADNVTKTRVTKYYHNDTNFKMGFINLILTKIINIFGINTKEIRVPIINLLFDKITNFVLPKRKYLLKYNIYKGSNRITLSYKHVKRIINFLESDEGKRFYNSFKMSNCADELFFQTMLLNSPLSNEIKNESLWYIRRDNGRKPFILTINDSKKIKDSKKLFARKFDINEDWQIINLLENNTFESI